SARRRKVRRVLAALDADASVRGPGRFSLPPRPRRGDPMRYALLERPPLPWPPRPDRRPRAARRSHLARLPRRAACPSVTPLGAEEIRREHEEALKMKQSIWDRDVRDTVGAARHGVGRLIDRIRSRVRHRDEYQSMSEVG